MSSQPDDGLWDDMEDEIPRPEGLDAPAPEHFDSIWDDPHIQKVEKTEKGPDGLMVKKRSMWCWWCEQLFKFGKNYNITKAEAHLMRLSGFNIQKCSGTIRDDYVVCYQNMKSRKETAKAMKEESKGFFQMRQTEQSRKVQETMLDRKPKAKAECFFSIPANRKHSFGNFLLLPNLAGT